MSDETFASGGMVPATSRVPLHTGDTVIPAALPGSTVSAIRLGYLRAALDRLARGEFRSPQVMADVAKAALDLDDTLAP